MLTGFLDADGDQTADQVDTNSDGVIDGPVEVRDDASDSITGDPNQPTDPSLPTPLLRPSIGVAKTIVNLDIDTQAQTLTQVFNVVIENFGDLPVYNLGLSDDQVALLALDPAAVGLQVTGATSGDRLSGGGFVVVAPASADWRGPRHGPSKPDLTGASNRRTCLRPPVAKGRQRLEIVLHRATG